MNSPYILRLSVAVLCLIPNLIIAQLNIQGTVVDQNGDPLIGVSIVIQGTNTGTTSDLEGSFSLTISDNEAILEFSYLGFQTETVAVDAANTSVSVQLREDVASLEEVVVTGLASSIKRSNLANSVASIDAGELTGVTTQSTMDGALYGKFKGAEIKSSSGAPGGGMSIRLRGVTSIFGDQQPLFIVDGIYIDNRSISLGTDIVSEAAGGGAQSSDQDDASNRIADIDPEDIETIEILKGASAAAIYGSRAAGGVVIITTKRGREGKTRVTLSQSIGFARPIRLLGTRDWNEEKVRTIFNDANAELFRQNGATDYEAELYDHNRIHNTTRVSASGGTEKTNFFIGATYKNEDGLVDRTGYEKASARINLGHKFNDWLDISATTNYINSTADRGFFNNGNTNTTIGYAMAFTRPWENLFPDADGNYPAARFVASNVLETVALITNRENVNRFLGGLTANARLYSNERSSLKFVLSGGVDAYTLRTTSIFPRQLSFYRDPESLGGASISGTTVNLNTNISAFLVHTYAPTSKLFFRTQAGVTQADFDLNTVVVTATGLNGSQTNIDQAENVASLQNREIQQDKGFFVQEEVNFNDQLIMTVGLRGDKSSNNGDANKLFYYPKASTAINLHNFGFMDADNGLLSQLKLRAAYGQSGRFANFEDRFNALEGTLIVGNAGLIPDDLRGNTDVEPERQSEIEFGVDLGFFKNRLNFDITYYIKRIDDLLLQAEIATSQGFDEQVLNAGELQNKGVEIGLNALPITGEFTWNTGVNFWRNQSEVTRLDIPAFNTGGFAAALGEYRIQEGFSATQIVGPPHSGDCLSEDDCSNVDPDGDGFQVYGDAEPDFNMSFINQISYKGFDLSFLFHWKKGGDNINLSPILYDLANLTWDYDDTTIDPNGEITNGNIRKSVFFVDPKYYVEDASYLRLREIGLYYNFPRSMFNDVFGLRLGLSGQNLINVFDYNSYDPEVSNFGNNVLGNSVEVGPYPTRKRFNLHVIATF